MFGSSVESQGSFCEEKTVHVSSALATAGEGSPASIHVICSLLCMIKLLLFFSGRLEGSMDSNVAVPQI